MRTVTIHELERFCVPPGRITLWWLGQAGFLVKTPAGKLVAIDPYLSNSCQAIGEQLGFDMDRLVPPVHDARGSRGHRLVPAHS